MKRFLALLLIVVLPVIALADEAADDYRLIEATGDVAVVPAGSEEARAATAGLPLSEGDRVVTGDSGSAELADPSGTVLRLEANSSLSLESLRTGWTTFRLAVGRLLAKFNHTMDSHYSVQTPVAVASVRGTEFALDVAEDGELNAGVVDGQVAIQRPENSEQPAGKEWKEEVLEKSQGLSIRPLERPRRLSEIPRPLVRSLDWFPRIRERVPKLREQWKNLTPLERRQLRRESLRERVQWRVPGKPGEGITPLRERVRPRPIPRPRRLRAIPRP